MPKTPTRKAAAPPTNPPAIRRVLSPRLTGPALGVATLGVIVLAVLLALGVNGDTPQALSVTTCQVGTTGCALRAPTHIHANFALVVRGQRYDFNQPQFLSVDGNDRSALAHLHGRASTLSTSTEPGPHGTTS